MNKEKKLIIDTNAFNRLSNKIKFESMLISLKNNNDVFSLHLSKHLKKNSTIKPPVSFIELLGFNQKEIHKILQSTIEQRFQDIKPPLDQFICSFLGSKKNPIAIKNLTTGFSDALETLYKNAYEHFLKNEPRFSVNGLRKQIQLKIQDQKNASRLFEDYLKYASLNIKTIQKGILNDLSIESISRYGKILISRLYTGNKELNQIWHDHISATYFKLWEERRNISAYRTVGEELFLINEKHKLNFCSSKKLRQHDDTVDGYIVHTLSFGWFCPRKNLHPISILTEDPFDEVFARVQQYQAFLAYAQNPILPNDISIAPRILHELQPGTLFALDRDSRSIKCVTFYPAKIITDGGNIQIQHSSSNIQEIYL